MAVLEWLEEAGIPYSIVLTKCDKGNSLGVVKMVNQICMRYHSLMFEDSSEKEKEEIDELMDHHYVFQNPVVHVTSGKKRLGINEILWMMNTDFQD